MPVLDNPRWERYAQLRAKGKTGRDAYELAGYTADASGGNSTRLDARPQIIARIAELTDKAAKRAEVSKAWVMERLMRNAQLSLGEIPVVTPTDGEDGVSEEYRRDPAAANQALQLLGKELGMFVDRSISATTTLEELLDILDDEPAGDQGGEEAGDAEAPEG